MFTKCIGQVEILCRGGIRKKLQNNPQTNFQPVKRQFKKLIFYQKIKNKTRLHEYEKSEIESNF